MALALPPQGHSNNHTTMKTMVPSADILARTGKVALCAHVLVSHRCLLDILAGMLYTDLILKYPCSKKDLGECQCTNIWKLNSRAAQIKSQKRTLEHSVLSRWKKTIQRPPWIRATYALLFAPLRYATDAPLTNFFTKERLSQVLGGFDVGICRHMRYSDAYVLDRYEPKGVIDSDRCGPGMPCCCDQTGNDWGSSVCPDDSCYTEFRFVVIHAKGNEARQFIPPEPCEVLAIVTSRIFPSLETGTHPSWSGCALAPEEYKDCSPDFRRWESHQRRLLTKNREWYDRACVENLNRRAGTNIAQYCGMPDDCARSPQHAAELASTPERAEAMSQVLDVSGNLPPPYSLPP